ncbi:MAG: T9SS type A sorting domain-containing protein, partial [Bacteroidota bacterium]
KVKISLFDLNGKTVFSIFEGELQSHRENTFFIRSQGLVSGMYLLGIQGKTINRHERVMIVK